MKFRLALVMTLSFASAAAAHKLTTHAVRFCLDHDAAQKAWPAAARARGVEGVAMVRCVATARDRLERCLVESEAPAGEGFGAAALTLLNGQKAEAARIEDVKQESLFRIRVPFRADNVTRVGPTAPLLTDLQWTAAPTPGQVIAVYPGSARGLGQDASVRLICTAAADGALTGCAVNSETHAGEYEFGQAALKLTQHFRVAPETRAGRPTNGARVSFLVRFPRSLGNRVPARVTPLVLAGPTLQDVAHAFPENAAAELDRGRAVLHCIVGPTGKPADCKPRPGVGPEQIFAAAGLRLAPLYDVSLWEDGNPAIGAPVELSITFVKPKPVS